MGRDTIAGISLTGNTLTLKDWESSKPSPSSTVILTTKSPYQSWLGTIVIISSLINNEALESSSKDAENSSSRTRILKGGFKNSLNLKGVYYI